MGRSKVCLIALAGLWCYAGLQSVVHAADTEDNISITLSIPQPVDNSSNLLHTEVAQAVSSYLQLITELETRQSSVAVDVELSEAYYGLGNALQTLGRHEEAVEAFDKALQALRKNKGLYELEQLPLLQARLDSSQALAAWREVDAGRQLAYLITLKNP